MIGNETIGKAFERAVRGIAPCYLSEAETEEYPYIVYESPIVMRLDKDGVQAYESSLRATIIADDPNVAENIAGLVALAVKRNMASYGVFPETLDRNCNSGIWQIDLTWTIRQTNASAVPGSGSGSGSSNGQSA